MNIQYCRKRLVAPRYIPKLRNRESQFTEIPILFKFT